MTVVRRATPDDAESLARGVVEPYHDPAPGLRMVEYRRSLR